MLYPDGTNKCVVFTCSLDCAAACMCWLDGHEWFLHWLLFTFRDQLTLYAKTFVKSLRVSFAFSNSRHQLSSTFHVM